MKKVPDKLEKTLTASTSTSTRTNSLNLFEDVTIDSYLHVLFLFDSIKDNVKIS